MLATVLPSCAGAQGRPSLTIMGQAIGTFTAVNPVPRDSGMSEWRVVQPVLMLQGAAAGGRLRLLATANFEGATIRHGELAPGNWGEGFIDRRHPHTWVHELVLSWRQAIGGWRVGLAAGKGFAPFGTDDPMSRPALIFPVNHHLSQIIERAFVAAGAGAGPVTVELATFNGDEPERPSQWPNWSRFGDSWSVRATWLPAAGVEAQASFAHVKSPEHRLGAASPQFKWSASLRWDRMVRGRPLYALAEWARTSELEGAFVFSGGLLEAAATLGRHRPYGRLERTERPEEERLLDPFHSLRPHLENSILGITRWTVATAGYTVRGPRRGRFTLWPLVEVSGAHVTRVTGGVFDPADFYGRATIWSASLGLRLDVGMPASGHRMGRYGVLSAASHSAHTTMEH